MATVSKPTLLVAGGAVLESTNGSSASFTLASDEYAVLSAANMSGGGGSFSISSSGAGNPLTFVVTAGNFTNLGNIYVAPSLQVSVASNAGATTKLLYTVFKNI